MLLAPIPRPKDNTASSSRVELVCCACGGHGATLADLDGRPFISYYHPECTPKYAGDA